MNRKIVASIEARMSSTRLPGKVLLRCMGRPLLELLVERVKRSRFIDGIVVATTVNSPDDEIVSCAKGLGINYFRGSEDDVLGRVTKAMETAKADVVVQLTGDNPLVDPKIIDQLLRLYLHNSFDLVTNSLVRSYPIGLDVKVTSLNILKKSIKMAKGKAEHEHVLFNVINNPSRFKLFNLLAPDVLCRPDYRFTVDEKADFEFVSKIFKSIYPNNPNFDSLEIIKFLDKHPVLTKINSMVVQKKVR